MLGAVVEEVWLWRAGKACLEGVKLVVYGACVGARRRPEALVAGEKSRPCLAMSTHLRRRVAPNQAVLLQRAVDSRVLLEVLEGIRGPAKSICHGCCRHKARHRKLRQEGEESDAPMSCGIGNLGKPRAHDQKPRLVCIRCHAGQGARDARVLSLPILCADHAAHVEASTHVVGSWQHAHLSTSRASAHKSRRHGRTKLCG